MHESVICKSLVGPEGPYQKAWRSQKTDGSANGQIALDELGDLVRVPVNVCVELSHIDAGLAHLFDHALFRNAFPRNVHQRMMNIEVFSLILGRQRYSRTDDGGRLQDRPVFIDEPDLSIGLDEALKVLSRLLQNGQL